MMRRSILSRLLAAASSLLVTPGTSLSLDMAEMKNRPVTKVITVLKDMLKQLEKEGEEDEEIYDKMACWCETNDKEKTSSIKDAEVRIEQLTTKIAELKAVSGRLNVEIKNHDEEFAELQDALDKATALREKQLAEFNAEEKDLLQSISSLKAAITVLSKHNGGAFLQMPRSHMVGVAATLQNQMSQHASLLEGVLTPSERKVVAAFLQDPAGYMNAEPTFKQSYAPQSGEIFGILRQMLETFEANLSASQKEEVADQKAYEDLKAAKEDEIRAAKAQFEAKTSELADRDEELANSKVDLNDSKESLTVDEQFLMMLKEKCSMTDKEWEERQKTRQLEMEAVSKALSVLSGDEAHDLFTKTFNPSFLQTESSDRRAAASKVLSTVASKLRNPGLSALAYQVKLDSFTRVKKAIDDMMTALKKQKDDEIKKKDWCLAEFSKDHKLMKKFTSKHESVNSQVESLNLLIKKLTKEIEQLEREIEQLKNNLKDAGEERNQQNKEFQQIVADQSETIRLLNQALTFLKDFYNKRSPSLVQRQEPAGPPPPAGFETYDNNAQSGGVMQLIQQIIDDARQMQSEATRAEDEAQQAYEDFVQETKAAIAAKMKEIIEKKEEKAKCETELVEAEKTVVEVTIVIEGQQKYNGQLHEQCDFLLHNFELRQTAFDEEMEALRQARAILSGAKFEEFLQMA